VRDADKANPRFVAIEDKPATRQGERLAIALGLLGDGDIGELLAEVRYQPAPRPTALTNALLVGGVVAR